MPPFGVTAQTSGDIVIQRVTYSLAGQAIAVRVTGDPNPANNGLFYLHSDHLGSTSAMSNSSGQLVGEVTRYTPYGAYRSGGPNAITDRGFTGQKENMELGLYYYNARYYVPYLNRFISADTIVPDPTNPQSFNRYTYALNNPLKYIDPTGHYTCESPDALCQPTFDPWIFAKRAYNIGDDLAFAPEGSNGVERYDEFAISVGLLSGHMVTTNNSTDIFLEAGSSGYFGIGGGTNVQAGFSDPNFFRSLEFEFGKGIGFEINDLGVEINKHVGWSGDGQSIEYEGTLGIFSGAEGVTFDPEAVIVRPIGSLAIDLANGSNLVWEKLWGALYDPQPLPPGIQGPQPVLLSPNLTFSNMVPYDSVFRDYGNFLPIYPIGYVN